MGLFLHQSTLNSRKKFCIFSTIVIIFGTFSRNIYTKILRTGLYWFTFLRNLYDWIWWDFSYFHESSLMTRFVTTGFCFRGFGSNALHSTSLSSDNESILHERHHFVSFYLKNRFLSTELYFSAFSERNTMWRHVWWSD